MEASIQRGGRSIRGKVVVEAKEYLASVTGLTGGRVFDIDPGANFTEIFLRVLSEMENRYLLSYEPTGVSLEGWHELEVELKTKEADGIRTRPGYLVRTDH